MSAQELIWNLDVTVAGGVYVLTDTGSDQSYTGGTANVLELEKPGVYNLVMADADYATHPLALQAGDSTGNDGPYITEGVTVLADTPSSGFTTIQVVSEELPESVRIVCTEHPNMGGQVDFFADGPDLGPDGYDHDRVQHFNLEAETASAVYLTIENTAENTLTVSVESADNDPVDLVLVGAQATPAAQVSAMTLQEGVASIDLVWPDGAPELTSFEVLWSKESNAGNWMLRQDDLGEIDTSFIAYGETGGGTGGPVVGENLIADGTFDDPSAWFGEGANVAGGVNTANIEQAGESYHVSLGTTLNITGGETYTITFDASGEAGRALKVGIGLNAAPWSANTYDLTLTADTKTYTVELIALDGGVGGPFSAADGRVFFDMGHDTGEVVIDNVSVVLGGDSGGETGGETGGPVVDPYANLVADGAFDQQGTWTGEGYFVNSDGVNEANVAVAGESYWVNLQADIDLSPGADYVLTFDAWGDAGRSLIAGIGAIGTGGDGWFNDSVEIELTTEPQEYRFKLSAVDAKTETVFGGGANGDRVFFDMGHEIGRVYIDNVSVMLDMDMVWSESKIVGDDGAWIGGLDDLTNAEFVTADGFVDDLESGSISVGDMSVSVRVADFQETLSRDDLNWAAEVIAGNLGHAVAGEMGWSQAFTEIFEYLGESGINLDDLAVDLLADHNDASKGPGSVVMYIEPKFDMSGNVLDQPPEFGARVYGDYDSTEDGGGWNKAPTDGFEDYLAPVVPEGVQLSNPDFAPIEVDQSGDYPTIVLAIWSDEQAAVVSADDADNREPTIQILGYDIETVVQADPNFFELMKTAGGRVTVDGPDGFGSVVRLSAEAVNAVGRVKDDYRVVWLTYSDAQLESGHNVVDLIGEPDVHNWRAANFNTSTLSSMSSKYSSGGEIHLFVGDWPSMDGQTSKVAVVVESVATGDTAPAEVNLNQYPDPGPSVESLFFASQGFAHDSEDAGFGVGEFEGTDASDATDAVRITGTSGDDELTGGDYDDQIDGGAGNDTIDAGAGADRITGGPGNDTIDGGENGTGDYFGYEETDHEHVYSDVEVSISGLDFSGLPLNNAQWVAGDGSEQTLPNDAGSVDLSPGDSIGFRVFAFDGVEADATQLNTVALGFSDAFDAYVGGGSYEALKTAASGLGLLPGNDLPQDYAVDLMIPHQNGDVAGFVMAELMLGESQLDIYVLQDYASDSSGASQDMGPDIWQVGDRAIYGDYRSAYDISTNDDGDVVVTHLNGGEDGQDTLTNVEILEFLGETVLLAPQTNSWSYINYEWDDEIGESVGYTVLEANTEGTVLDDEIDGAETNEGVGARDWMRGYGGDDKLTGGKGGDSMSPGQGNDIVDGEESGDTGNPWQDNNRLELEGAKRRYDIEEVSLDGDPDTLTYVLSDGTITTDDLDESEQQLALYTVKGTGEVYRWKAGVQNTDSSHTFNTDISASFFVVSDSLTEAQGGEGIDLVANVQEINFSDDWMTLVASTYGYYDEWSGVWRYDVQGSQFGELIDMTAYETGGINETFDRIQANDGDDVIYAGAGGDSIRGGKGDDFIDGGDNAIASDVWPTKDEAFFDGKASRFTVESLTKAQARELTTVDLTSYADSDTFFSVTDTKSGDVDILVNVEAIGFNDEYMNLGISVDGREDSWLQTWSYNWQGTGQDDVMDVSDGGDYVNSYVANSRDWMDGGQGDDVLVSGGGGDQLQGGRGNDILDGGANGTVTDPWMSWAARDEARFEGNAARFDIEKVTVANLGDSGHEVVDALDNAVFRIYQDGKIYRYIDDVEQTEVAYQVSTDASVFVVSDTLLAAYGGQGVDILTGVEGLSFNDEWMDLDVRIEAQEWNQGAWVQGTGFDDLIDVRDGVAYESGGQSGGSPGISGLQYFSGLMSGDLDLSGATWLSEDGSESVTLQSGLLMLSMNAGNTKIRAVNNGDPDALTPDTLNNLANDIGIELGHAAMWTQTWAETVTAIEGLIGTDGVLDYDILIPYQNAGNAGYVVVGVDEINSNVQYVNKDKADVKLSTGSESQTEYFDNSDIDPGAGDDIIIAGDGADRVRGSLGDDYVDLGDSGTIDPDNPWDTWNVFDRVQYDAAFDRFEITEGYTVRDATTLKPIFGLDGGYQFAEDGNALTDLGYTNEQIVEALRVADRLSDAAGGDGVDIIVGADELSFEDAWVELSVRQNAWTNSQYIAGESVEYTEVEVRGTFKSEIVQATNTRDALGDRYDGYQELYADRLRGEDGNDVLVGGAGGDEFEGGYGDDILLGGSITQDADLVGVINDSWIASDRARYYGPVERFEVSRKYVELGDDLDALLGTLKANGAAGFDLYDAPAAGRVSVIVVEDSLPDDQGGLGTDILFGIEQIEFNTDDEYARIDTRPNYEMLRWDAWFWNDRYYDYRAESVEGQEYYAGFFVEGTIFDDKIDVSETRDLPGAGSYTRSIVRASQGDDTYYGTADGYERLEYQASRDEFVLTVFEDADGETAVRVEHVLAGGVAGAYGTDVLYDIDSINFSVGQTSDVRLQNLFEWRGGSDFGGSRATDNGGYFTVRTSILDDFLDLGSGDYVIDEQFGVLRPSALDTDNNQIVSDAEATIDASSIDTAPQLDFIASSGDDIFVGGANFDRVRYGLLESELNVVQKFYLLGTGDTLVEDSDGNPIGYATEALAEAAASEGDTVLAGFEAGGVSASGYDFGTDTLFDIESVKYDLLNGDEQYVYLVPIQRPDDNYVTGTRFNDRVESSMGDQYGYQFSGDSRMVNIELFGGDDYADLSDVNGDQRVIGGAGDDTILFGDFAYEGGNGIDMARFYGLIDDFTIKFFDADGVEVTETDGYQVDGYITVTDNVGDEGTDTIYGAERISFAWYYDTLAFEEGVTLSDSSFYNTSYANFDNADPDAVQVDGDGNVTSNPQQTLLTTSYADRDTSKVLGGVVINMDDDNNLDLYEGYSYAMYARVGTSAQSAHEGRFVQVNNRTGEELFDGFSMGGTSGTDIITGSARIDRFWADAGNDVYIGNGTKGLGPIFGITVDNAWDDADEVVYRGIDPERFDMVYVDSLSADQVSLFNAGFGDVYGAMADQSGYLVTDTATGDIDFLSGIDRVSFAEWDSVWLTVREEIWDSGTYSFTGTDLDDRIVSVETGKHNIRPGGGDDVVIGPDFFGTLSISAILGYTSDEQRGALYDSYSEVEYNGEAKYFTIESLTDTDLDSDNVWDATGLRYNPSAERDYRTDGPNDPPEYFLITDTRDGWNGTDVVFGIERIRFSSGDDSERFDLVPFFEVNERDFWDEYGNQTTEDTLWVRDGIAGYDYSDAIEAATAQGLQSVSYEASYGDDTYVGLLDDDLYTYVWEGDTVRFEGRQSDFRVEVLPDDDGGNRVVRVTDLRDGGYGVNTLVNIETIRFEDPTSTTNNNDIVLVPEYRDWDNDGDIDSFEGTQFGDILVGDGGRNNISGGAGNDNLIGGPSGDWIRPGSGHDFIDGSVTQGSGDDDLNDWETRNEVNFDAPSDRVTITSVWVGLDADGFAVRNADGSFKTYESAGEAETGTGGTAVLAYYAVDDLPVGADGSVGTNVLINIDAIGFNDDWFELTGRRDERDWDGDGVIDEVFSEGTPFDDDLDGSSGNDYMNAREGDDHLRGFGGGDNLRGGTGDDVIDGGANGNTGDPWRDLDTAEYNGVEGRYTISGALTDVDEDADGVWDNTLRAYEDGDTAPVYYTIEDSLAEDLGGTGTDVLVGIERIRFRESEIDLGLRVYTQDWDGDGQVDWSEVRGTNNDDTIIDGVGGLDLSNDDEIRGREGDDVIKAGAGGDRISGGAGDDFIDGGADGTPYGFNGERLEDGYTEDQVSWRPKDEVRYDGSRDRFEIYDSSDTDGLAAFGFDFAAWLGDRVIEEPDSYKVIRDTLPDAAGGYGVDVVVNAEFISFSDDFIALQAETWINYDPEGNEIGRSVNGTLSGEMLLGGQGDDNIWGADGDDILRGKAGGDWLEGGAGDDTIYGGKDGVDDWGNVRYDTAVFSGDYDEYTITTEDHVVDGVTRVAIIVEDSDASRDGTDTLYGVEQLQFMDEWVQVTVTQESMFDHDGNETGLYMRGSILGDTLTGASFGDILEGGAGNDTISGGGGADRIYGGTGNDTIDGGANGLDPWGNPGQDVAVYEGIQSRYTVTYFDADGEVSQTGFDPDGSVQVVDSVAQTAGGEGTDTLVGIERLEFSDSSLSFQSLNVFVDLDGDGFPDQGQVFGTTGDDVLNGSEFDEKLIGDAGKDVLYGGAGGDRLDGGAGNDVLVGGLDGAPDAAGRRRPDVAEIDGSVSSATIADGYVLQKADGSLVTNSEADGFSNLNTNTASFGAAVFDSNAQSHDDYTWKAAKILSYTDSDGDSQTDVLVGVEVVEFNDAVVSTSVKTNRVDFDRDGVVDEIVINGTLGGDTIDQGAATAGLVIDAGPGDDIVTTGSGSDQIRLGTGTDSVTDSSSDDFDILILQGNRADWTENAGVWSHDTYGAKTVSGVELVQFDDEVVFLSNQVESIDYDGDGEADGLFVKLAADSSYSVDLSDATVAGLAHTIVGADASGSEDDVLVGGNGGDVLIGGAGANTLVGGGNDDLDGAPTFDVAVFDGTHLDVTDDDGNTTEADFDVAAKFFVVAADGSVGDAYDTEAAATDAAGNGSVVSGFTVTEGSNVNKVVGVEVLQFSDGVLALAPSVDVDTIVKPTGVVESYTIRGTQFADTIVGQTGADDVLIGGASLDQFVFGDGSGFDQILDFTIEGTDTNDDGTPDAFETIKIQIDSTDGLNGNTNIEDAADVLNLVNSSLDGALIDLGGGNQVLIVGVDADDLTTSHIAVEIV